MATAARRCRGWRCSQWRPLRVDRVAQSQGRTKSVILELNRSEPFFRFGAFGILKSKPRFQGTIPHNHSVGGEFHGYTATEITHEVLRESFCASDMRHDTPEEDDQPRIRIMPLSVSVLVDFKSGHYRPPALLATACLQRYRLGLIRPSRIAPRRFILATRRCATAKPDTATTFPSCRSNSPSPM